MSEQTTTTRGPEGGIPPEEEEVRRLLERAGPRPEVPPEELAAIKAAFRAAWGARLEQRRDLRRGRRWEIVVPLAAAVLIALGVGWWSWKRVFPAPVAVEVARIERLEGSVVVRAPGEEGEALATAVEEGQALPAGAVLETAAGEAEAPGRVALRLASGTSLRFDTGSRGRLESAAALRLDRGAVYADTGAGRREDGGIEITTPLGVASDLGTQFEVRLLAAKSPAMRVRVRQGTVLVGQAGGSFSAAAGTELTLRSDGSMRRAAVPTYGSPWAWVLAAAPRPDIEGWTLPEFLAWVSRETGWEVRFADPSVASAAGEIHVYATLGDLTPEEAPAAVLPGAGLDFEVVDGVLVIR